jgi:hypothetical protein
MSNKNRKSVLETESTSDDTFIQYNNVIEEYKELVNEQCDEINNQQRKIIIIEKALEMKSQLDKQTIKEKNLQIEEMKKELDHRRGNEKNKSLGQMDVREAVRELHEIRSRKRNNALDKTELDAEATEYLKQYE